MNSVFQFSFIIKIGFSDIHLDSNEVWIIRETKNTALHDPFDSFYITDYIQILNSVTNSFPVIERCI